MKRNLFAFTLGILSLSACATHEDPAVLNDDLNRITERYEMFEVLDEGIVSDSLEVSSANYDIRTPYILLVN